MLPLVCQIHVFFWHRKYFFSESVCLATGFCWDNDRVRHSLITHCSWAKQAPLPPLFLPLLRFLCLFLFSSTLPIRECWWDVFAERKRYTHTSLCCWVTGCGQGRDVLLFYIRDAFVCWGLTHSTCCQNPPFLPTYLLFLYYLANSWSVFSQVRKKFNSNYFQT